MKQYRLEWFTNNGRPSFLNLHYFDRPINMKVYDVTLTHDTINVNGWEMKLNHVHSDYSYRLLKTRIDVSMWFFAIDYFSLTSSVTFANETHIICEHVIKYGTRN